MAKIRVAQVGCGNRGNVHLEGWLGQPERFEVVALCELDAARMRSTVDELGLDVAQYADADRMLAETRPDLFCFVTQPGIRLAMVELAAKHGVRGLAFEKPMALSLAEARRIVELCRGAGIKATVCQQHIYTSSFQQLKRVLDAGDIGRPTEIHVSTTGNLFDRGTHYTHYLLWAGGFAQPRWVVGHVHGRTQLQDAHPSPDLCLVRLELAGGVYGLGEYGGVAPRYDSGDAWQVNRLTVRGTEGTVWAENSGIWGTLSRATGGEPVYEANPGYSKENPGAGWNWESPRIQQGYAGQIADWLQGSLPDHPCNVEHAYTGFEVLAAACYSSMEQVRVDLPLADPAALTRDGADVFQRLHTDLPTTPLLRPLS
jgi:predicted dehydrogenase